MLKKNKTLDYRYFSEILIIKNKGNKSDLSKRLVTALILIILVSIFLFFGSSSINLYGFTHFNLLIQAVFGFIYLFLGIFLLFFILLEYFKVYLNFKKYFLPFIWLFIVSLFLSYGPTFLYYLDYVNFYHISYRDITLILGWIELSGWMGSIILLTFYKLIYLKNITIQKTFSFYLMFFLISYFFFFFNLILILHSWTTLLILWIPIIFNDSFAFFGGKKFGKHKLAPIISPKKTWEGFFTGLFTSIASILIIGSFYLLNKNESINIFSKLVINNNIQGNIFAATDFYQTKYSYLYVYFLVLIVFGILISILGTYGDLTFSYFKRKNNIKDFSHILPGHGGFLDRIDSIIFVVIFFGIYYLVSSAVDNQVYALFPYLYS